jgi:hypothetical protein
MRSTFNYALLGTVLLAALFPLSSFAGKSADLAKQNLIECEETDGSASESEDGPASVISVTTVKKSADGVITQIQFKRPAADGLQSIDWRFNKGNSIIQQIVRKIDPESDDYMGIPETEVIDAVFPNGQGITLHVNDHNYAGSYGSTVDLQANGKSLSSEGHLMFCRGDVQFPGGQDLDAIEDELTGEKTN